MTGTREESSRTRDLQSSHARDPIQWPSEAGLKYQLLQDWELRQVVREQIHICIDVMSSSEQMQFHTD